MFEILPGTGRWHPKGDGGAEPFHLGGAYPDSARPLRRLRRHLPVPGRILG